MKDADQNAEKEYNLIRMLAVTWTKSDLHGLGHFNLDPSSGSLLLFLFPSGFFDVVEMCMSCSIYKKTLQNREQMDSLFHKVFLFLFSSAYHCGENEFLLFSQMSFAATTHVTAELIFSA